MKITRGVQAYVTGVLHTALLVAFVSCGGGGGSSSSTSAPAAPPSPIAKARPLHFGYYGSVAHADGASGPSSVLETAAHVNLVWTGPWGDWTTAQGRQDIADEAEEFLIEAAAHDVPNAIVDVSFTLWTSPPGAMQYRGTAELRTFLTDLRAHELAPMVRYLYLQDEPELYGIDATALCRAATDVRALLAELGYTGVKLAVVYSADLGKLPGIDCVDVAGFDDYGNGTGIFQQGGEYDAFVSRLRADQQTFIIAGGSCPWNADPEPFYEHALTDPRVAALIGFVWWDHWNLDSPDCRGIRSNGLAAAYVAVGQRVLAGP